MNIDVVFPVLPPTLNGIGDHTALLAEALAARGCQVRILTAQSSWTPVKHVRVEQAFSLRPPYGVCTLQNAVRNAPPDLLFVQFNQFSYGPFGFNPFLPWTLRSIKKARPEVSILWMAHEEFVPMTNWKNALMSIWQRLQFWSLGRTADIIGLSISPWIEKFESWFPNTPIHHLPVGSNISHLGISRDEARSQLQIDASFVVGYFGSIGGSRHLDHVRSTLQRLNKATGGDLLFLYVGAHGATIRRALGDVPLRDAGTLSADEVSLHFSAMDLYLAPFVKGVSTRRGSFMASLQHGVPTIATDGPQTDSIFREHDGRAVVLAPEEEVGAFAAAAEQLYRQPQRRRKLGETGQLLYEKHFDWPILARRVKGLIPHRTIPAS